MWFLVAEVALDALLLRSALGVVGEVALACSLLLVVVCTQRLEARVIVSLGLDVVYLTGDLRAPAIGGLGDTAIPVSL